MKRLLRSTHAFLSAACLAMGAATAQVPGAQTTAVLTQPSSAQAPSSLVQPALKILARAGSAVDLNHWKGSGESKAEVDNNLRSMQTDVESTLPDLLRAADAAPTSAATTLPVLLNLDALYSVLLRVTIASRTAAPRAESAALEQAATQLDTARRNLGEAVLRSATASEQQVKTLQATVQQQQLALQQAQQPPAKPAPASKPRRKAASTTSHTSAAAKP